MKVSENIKRIVKNEILLDTDLESDDDFLKVIKLSEVILKKNPLFESKYSELINEIIFDMLRKNNMAVNNIVLFIIIGIKDFTREHIQLSAKELSDVLVNQSNEVKLNDKLNTALSSIMDRSPKDIKEQINPDTKTKILLFLKNSNVIIEGFDEYWEEVYEKERESVNNAVNSYIKKREGIKNNNNDNKKKKNDKTYWEKEYIKKRELSNSLSREQIRKGNVESNDIYIPDVKYEDNVEKQYSKLKNRIPDIIKMKINQRKGIFKPREITLNENSDYQSEMNKINQKYGEDQPYPEPILASYIDSNPDIFKGVNNEHYYYDETSGTFTQINDDTDKKQKLTKEEIEQMLKEHEVSDFEIKKTLNLLYSANNENGNNNVVNEKIKLLDNINNNNNNDNNVESMKLLLEVEKLRKQNSENKIYIYLLLTFVILFLLIIIIMTVMKFM